MEAILERGTENKCIIILLLVEKILTVYSHSISNNKYKNEGIIHVEFFFIDYLFFQFGGLVFQ